MSKCWWYRLEVRRNICSLPVLYPCSIWQKKMKFSPEIFGSSEVSTVLMWPEAYLEGALSVNSLFWQSQRECLHSFLCHSLISSDPRNRKAKQNMQAGQSVVSPVCMLQRSCWSQICLIHLFQRIWSASVADIRLVIRRDCNVSSGDN